MSQDLNPRLLDLRAQQQSGELIYCPRCGQESMKPVLEHNALSRMVDLYVCDDCGIAEAMLDLMRNPLPLAQWAAFDDKQVQLDFKALSMAEMTGRIVNKQVPLLTQIFEAWSAAGPQMDFSRYQAQAQQACPGLYELRRDPFCAVYKAQDGKVLIRFRMQDGQSQVAMDYLAGS